MRALQTSLDKRRQDVDRIERFTVDRAVVEGTFKVLGSGEGTVDINFPVQFIEKPVFLSGVELESGHAPTTGSTPFVSVVVTEWKTVERPGDVVYYNGCRLVLEVTGDADLESYVHVYFHGKHLKNPVRASMDPKATI